MINKKITNLYVKISVLIAFVCSMFLSINVNAALLYQNITAAELYERITDGPKGFTIVDVRPSTDYDTAHIPGAVNIPLRELGYRLYELKKTDDIITYCQLGLQSKIAAQVLANAGFKDVYNLTGGFIAWTYPIETDSGRVLI
ncbi:MAG: rhodanese-like domain-containing protein [Candidatus Omnitrophica bacterium]|nr:rhodanese-like domain-containing protein [Candidatus Omnitrophota bacterium]